MGHSSDGGNGGDGVANSRGSDAMSDNGANGKDDGVAEMDGHSDDDASEEEGEEEDMLELKPPENVQSPYPK